MCRGWRRHSWGKGVQSSWGITRTTHLYREKEPATQFLSMAKVILTFSGHLWHRLSWRAHPGTCAKQTQLLISESCVRVARERPLWFQRSRRSQKRQIEIDLIFDHFSREWGGKTEEGKHTFEMENWNQVKSARYFPSKLTFSLFASHFILRFFL